MSQAKPTAAELAEFREQLQALTARLSGAVTELRGGGAAAAVAATDPDHQGDPSARDEEAALATSLLGTEEQVLAEVRAALKRVEAGTFGRCESCAQPIARARLKALPYARYCIDCARASETGRAG